jgi:hypothetical protein
LDRIWLLKPSRHEVVPVLWYGSWPLTRGGAIASREDPAAAPPMDGLLPPLPDPAWLLKPPSHEVVPSLLEEHWSRKLPLHEAMPLLPDAIRSR